VSEWWAEGNSTRTEQLKYGQDVTDTVPRARGTPSKPTGSTKNEPEDEEEDEEPMSVLK
jgi:hypothetical protein